MAACIPLADPELQKRGGKFLRKFFMTLLAGAKSVANIDRGPKSLHFAKFTMLSFFLPPRGTKLHCQLRWGAMAGLAPWILHCCSLCPTSILIHNALFTAALYNIGLSWAIIIYCSCNSFAFYAYGKKASGVVYPCLFSYPKWIFFLDIWRWCSSARLIAINKPVCWKPWASIQSC